MKCKVVSFLRQLKSLWKGCKYLAAHNFPAEMAGLQTENLKYELMDASQHIQVPQIRTIMQTLTDIQNKKLSLSRFGDGEFELLLGNSISFQRASPLLSQRLKEVLSSAHDHIAIGLPRVLYASKEGLTSKDRNFWNVYGPKFRSMLECYIHPQQVYYAAECTLPFAWYQQYDFDAYFDAFRQIWQQRDIAVIGSTDVLSALKYNIFDNAAQCIFQDAPRQHAFDSYDSILNQTCKLPKTTLILVILGPTATVLSYDLACKGYQALDIGHVAKAYNAYKLGNKGVPVTFFGAD